MSINLLHRVLSEPTAHERSILEADESVELEDISSHSSQTSFMNLLNGDLEARVTRVHKNTDQKLLIVTQDKTLLCLKRNLAKIGKRDWIAPLSTVTTILIALITSDFKSAIGLGPSEWKAIFIVSGFITTGWLGFTLHRAWHAKTFHEVIQDIILELSARKRKVPEIA